MAKVKRIIDLIFALRRMSYQQITTKHGTISYLQFITLRFIDEKKPLMKEVADFLAITPPSATVMVETLVSNGLVKRIPNSIDRRQVRVEVTLKGKNDLQNVTESMVQNMQQNLNCLTEKEKEDLLNILEKMANNKK